MISRYRIVLLTLFCMLLYSSLAIGQGTSGTLSGNVTDPQGEVVPGATITIKNLDTGLIRQATTSAEGAYRVVGLPPGHYELRTEHQGFNPEVRAGLTLTVAEQIVVNFNLKVSGTKEVILVNVETVGVETTGSTMSGLVDEKKVRDLPLNGRDIAQLILLQPGVVNSLGSTQSANTGRGTRFSVGGARPSQNLFQLDGTTINDALNNTPGSAQGLLVGVETVKEFRVLTNTFSAEYGRASGGVFVAVTKSGSNDLRGSAFEFLRNDNLDARNFFDRDKPEFRRNQFGFTLGGPVIRNKTFFFGSYEGLRELKGISTVAIVPDDNARLGILPGRTLTVDPRALPLLALFPRANGRPINNVETGAPTGTAEFISTTPRISRDDFFTFRGDHTISSTDSMFVRYLFDDSSQVLPRFFPDFPNQAVNRKQVITIEERKFIGANIVNEARFGFNRSTPSELVPTPASDVSLISGRPLGEINVADLTTVGTDRTNPKLFFQNNIQLVDNFFITQGKHNLKMGVSFDRFQFNGRSESRTRGRVRFRSLADLLQFRVRDIEGSGINSDFVRGFRQSLYGFFVQDDFKPIPRLTLNLGLRYEFATAPSEVNGKIANLRNILDPKVTIGGSFFETSKRGFAPRIGFAYDVTGNGKTALRGGFGLFYEQPLFGSYRDTAFGSLPFISTARIAGNQVSAFPVDPALFTSGTRLTESVQYHLQPTYTMQYNLNIQREVPFGTILTLAYVGSRGVNLFGQGDLNTAYSETMPDGRAYYPAGSSRRNPNFDNVRSNFQGFNSWYNAMNLSAAKRFSGGLQFQASYTFAKSIDERSGTSGRQEFSNGQARTLDPYDRSLDRGRSNFDVRHRFVANFTYDLPIGKNLGGMRGKVIRGWRVNSIMTFNSGIPFTPLIDGDPDRDGTDENSARPNLLNTVSLVPNGGQTPDLWFNPLAFGPPEPGYRGTLGRNVLTGPNFRTIDLSLVRSFQMDDRRSVQFRIEAFNLFNRANFDLPANSDDGSQIFNYTPASGSNPASFTRTPSAGRIFSTVGDARELQLALKFIF